MTEMVAAGQLIDFSPSAHIELSLTCEHTWGEVLLSNEDDHRPWPVRHGQGTNELNGLENESLFFA